MAAARDAKRKSAEATGTADREMAITRVIDTPRTLVFHPEQFEATVGFEEVGKAKTKLTLRLFQTAAECDKVKARGAIEGGQQTLGRLAAFLAKR